MVPASRAVAACRAAGGIFIRRGTGIRSRIIGTIWDFRRIAEDLKGYPHIPTNDRRQRFSQFWFHFEVGKSWGMKPNRAARYARRLLERAEERCQGCLSLMDSA